MKIWVVISIFETVSPRDLYISLKSIHEIEDIYFFEVNTRNTFTECNENISIFTSAKQEWKFECFYYMEENIYEILQKKKKKIILLFPW